MVSIIADILFFTPETADFLQNNFFSFKTENFYLIHQFVSLECEWLLIENLM